MYYGNSYKKFPGLYDLLYQRFLKTVPDFVSLVKKNTPKRGLILDLAAGTGEVTIPLLRHGFTVVSLDASIGMLKQLQKKAKMAGIKKYRTKVLDMKKLNYQGKFDVVCIRQAINYFMGTRSLTSGLKRINASLKRDGKFIFNAPNYQGQKNYKTTYHYYNKASQSAVVVETNTIERKTLRHTQYSIVWRNNNMPTFVNDENSFYIFTKKEFESSLKKSGFSKIRFSGSAKTLYGVATK